MIYTDTVDPSCRDRLSRDRARYLAALASQAYGKHGRELPAVRSAWADTPARIVLGAILLLASAIELAWALL